MTEDLPDVFRDGGDVGRDFARVDWSATALGPPDTWPQSLTTIVRVLLSSKFSMWMAWGPQLTFFCNDAYRRDTLGAKYPWALGRPANQVWEEIWPDIGPRIEKVMGTGVATWDEALLLFLERSGYPEESYHTFSYSPLQNDAGEIVGMLCVVSEDTERVIGQRRMATLRDLGSDPTAIRTESMVLAAAGQHLAANGWDLPFTLTYLFEDTGSAVLAHSTGIPEGHPAAPAVLEPGAWADGSPGWPVASLLEGRSVRVNDLATRYPDLPSGDVWDQPPVQALVVPIPQQGQTRPYGFLVAGLNRYRRLDSAYQSFVDLVAGQLAAGIASSRAYEAERYRAERLAELDQAKTTFFTNVSHEFRTPLTLLLGPAEDALSDTANSLPAVQRERMEVIARNGQRLLKLVNTLLDFSRLESGRLEAHFESTDLAWYTAHLAETFAVATERGGISLTIDCPPLDRPVAVDREMWAKIVLNLLSNALKFTFSGGIEVHLGAADGMAVLTVRDTGIGIEPSEQAHLFERFHRVKGARSRTHEGSGIGLALVAELAELHGGTVGVSSAPGDGSTFTVQVPLSSDHLVELPPPGDDVDAGAVADFQARGFLAEAGRWLGSDGATTSKPELDGRVAAAEELPRVLVVDDNLDMRDYIAQLLSDGYDVRTASDGEEGLAEALEHRPDLILTDVMMPRLDGFELLAALRSDPRTTAVPVVMLSARAGEEATVEGLDAGADDYLVKPFSARELLARVRANLELERVRRTRGQLEASQALLDQAQRLAMVGSWELDLTTGALVASQEFIRQLQLSAEELRTGGVEAAISQRVHPDDAPRVRAGLASAGDGTPLDFQFRVVTPDEQVRIYRSIAELVRDDQGRPQRLHGSTQDITDQREAERALTAAAAAEEAAAREHQLADDLQRSLLPNPSFDPDHLTVATYYRAGVEGIQVGGDWYDIIELGAGRTGLVMGDVMGRGVRAAAVMGQLRAAVRAYARLDLPPADVLEFLDSLVRDIGADQIVTCVYAVYDPGESSLFYANAGHLPPILRLPGEAPKRLTGGAGPPLGTGLLAIGAERVTLPPGALLTLYTDGLVEHRDSDLDTGIDQLIKSLETIDGPVDEVPQRLASALLEQGPEDDVAILVAEVHGHAQPPRAATRHIPAEEQAVGLAREFVDGILRSWQIPQHTTADMVLLVSELVTNAVIHGRPPIELRLRSTSDHLVLEVHDGANYLPRRMRPTPDDEHGRGLQLVSLLAERWGTRATDEGKALWCVLRVDGSAAAVF